MSQASFSFGAESIGIRNLLEFEKLPFLQEGVQVHYEGSIDKRGGNADWDWWLYKEGDENSPFFIFQD